MKTEYVAVAEQAHPLARPIQSLSKRRLFVKAYNCSVCEF